MNQPNRRQLLRTSACGFGALALAGLTNRESGGATASSIQQALPTGFTQSGVGQTNPVARAKRVIFIFMQGGPSQVDTFDPKPQLDLQHGKKVEFHVARTRKVNDETILRSPWKFEKHGQCGRDVSELFPEMAKCVDDFCLIRSMHTEGVAHGPATLFLHTGATNLIRPSVGGWISYGLGTENENLPAFVTINPAPTKGGPRNYSNAFLPSQHQATVIKGSQADDAIRHLDNPHKSLEQQREQIDLFNQINQSQRATREHDDRLNTAIESYELAFRMQEHMPQALDFASESQHVLDMYGIGQKETDEFGRQCLMARQLAEAGVRYIQVSYSEISDTPKWDQHSNLKAHETHAKATDLPVAGLLQDLKQRGLLEDTLVWWGGEFGRTPYSQNNNGRDHNPRGFSVWLAGGGVKPGTAYGETDDFGYEAVSNKVHMHDLHATMLHLLGLDHQRLTYRYAGRDFRLTDVHGRVIEDIIS